MILKSEKIAFGGGCHWCTEAVFLSLKGINKVEQGFIGSTDDFETLSEAVIVHFSSDIIPLKVLVAIHLNTHQSTSEHSMRHKYRSAIYTFSKLQNENVVSIIEELQQVSQLPIITKVLPFEKFTASAEAFTNYYYKNPEKPFCETYINPKLRMMVNEYSDFMNLDKMKDLKLYNNQLQPL